MHKYYKGSDRVDLTAGAQKKLRLCKIYKAVASVTYDDIFRNKWKIPLYMTPFLIGTTTAVLTMAYYMMAQNEKAMRERRRIQQAMKQPVCADLYKDFMTACAQNPDKLHLTTKNMMMYIMRWNYRYVREKLYNGGVLKRAIPKPKTISA